MRTFIFLPPLPRMTGGLAVLGRVGQHLAGAGFETFLVAREQRAWLTDLMAKPGMPPLLLWQSDDTLTLEGNGVPIACLPGPEDIWLAPEGWPHALLPGLRAGCRTVVYVQNWAYFLSEWPAGLEPARLPVHYVGVSRPVLWHIEQVTGRQGHLLRPGIDLDLFSARTTPSAVQAQEGPALTVAWMPRKNKALARQIREIVTARRQWQALSQPQWVEIANMTQEQVAKTLRRCDIFLATGFPEGCPLPPLEALASGCLGVGFSGFGGWDYMRVPTENATKGSSRDSPKDSPKDSPRDSPRDSTENQPNGSPEGGHAFSGHTTMAKAIATGVHHNTTAPCSEPGTLPCWVPEEVRLQADPRPANGFWVSDGDVMGAALALEKALALLDHASSPGHPAACAEQGYACHDGTRAGGPQALRLGARHTAQLYSLAAQKKAVLGMWNQAHAGRLFV